MNRPTNGRAIPDWITQLIQGLGPHVVEAQPPARFAGGENREIAPATLGKSPERREAPHARQNLRKSSPGAPIDDFSLVIARLRRGNRRRRL